AAGLADYFTKIVISQLKVKDVALRRRVEGPYFKEDANYQVPKPGFYKVSQHAERLVGLVGFRNAAAAFFRGEIEAIGGTMPAGGDSEAGSGDLHDGCDH
ncbi:MAG: hypothetical protein AAF570_12100, partial [Bacteroidota bacterium]